MWDRTQPKTYNTELFIEKVKENYGDNVFDFTKTVYEKYDRDVTITCMKEGHGDFTIPAYCMTRKGNNRGCNHCGSEKRARLNHIVGIKEKELFQPAMVDLFGKDNVVFQKALSPLPFVVDAYIPKLKLVIEYDEKHHYQPANMMKDAIREDMIKDHFGVVVYRVDDQQFQNNPDSIIEELEKRCVGIIT